MHKFCFVCFLMKRNYTKLGRIVGNLVVIDGYDHSLVNELGGTECTLISADNP